jgi:hypothetical protein
MGSRYLDTRQVTLQRTNTKNSKQEFPEKELRGHSPNFHIHVSVSDLCIPTIDLSILLQEIQGADDKLGQTLCREGFLILPCNN